MKNFKNIKIDSTIMFLITFIYLEILYKVFMHYHIFNISTLHILLYVLFFVALSKFISSIFGDVYNKILSYIIIFITTLFYATQMVVYKIFNFVFDFSLMGTTDQIMDFKGTGFSLVMDNLLYIIICYIPFIIFIIFHKRIVTKRLKLKENVIVLLVAVLFYVLFLGSLKINKTDDYSAYKLYFNVNNPTISLKKLGVLNSMFTDFERTMFGFDEKVIVEKNKNKSKEIKYDYNKLDIEFLKTDNEEINNMHNYFLNDEGTLKNEYTSYFKGKNLILFMAESFNEIAVDEKLTPTLYKLVNNGFIMDDFYTPTISSTLGGEFQELTGLVASSGFINPWKNGNNSFPFGIASMFKENGYNTYAYHNHNYYFQNRYKYLETLGFDNFLACKNGLEKKINCDIWPESDIEMINATINDYSKNKPFFVYYATVSGHGEYDFTNNKMSVKNKDYVKDLEYSDKVKAYLAAQIELDKALEKLIKKLEKEKVLNDTVIALVGDHYPYFLDISEVNELASYKKDDTIEINHSNFILWNNKMKNIHVKKVGSQIDVLPTIYNLFGIDYDSRLIIGKDILSNSEGLAIFADRSWVSDKGSFFAKTNEFVPNDGVEVDSNYVKKMNTKVSNKMNMSKLILTNDYYKYISVKKGE